MPKRHHLILLAGLMALSCSGQPTPSPLPVASNTPTRAPTTLAVTPTAVPSVTPSVAPAPVETATSRPATPAAGTATSTSPAPTVSSGETAIPTGAEQAVATSKADLARRTSTAASSITVVKVVAEEWPDSALGCAEPGKLYAQVITPGYRIGLIAGGKQYEYHSDQGTRVVLCQSQ